MNGFDLLNLSCYYVEIGQDWLQGSGVRRGSSCRSSARPTGG